MAGVRIRIHNGLIRQQIQTIDCNIRWLVPSNSIICLLLHILCLHGLANITIGYLVVKVVITTRCEPLMNILRIRTAVVATASVTRLVISIINPLGGTAQDSGGLLAHYIDGGLEAVV